MLSNTTSAAAAALRGMAADISRNAEDAGAALARIGTSVGGLAESWNGPTPTEFAGHARLATESVAAWPNSLAAAADTLYRWASRADDVSLEARRAERRLVDATRADTADRDVMVRSARFCIDEVANRWANICRLFGLELAGSMNTLATIADRPWGIGTPTSRATDIAMRVVSLDLNLDRVDSTGTVQATITALLNDVVASPVAPLVFTILETARDRDLFTADGDLSDHDLAAATDPTWAREAIAVWQKATGIELDGDAADAIAGLIPTVAWLMQVDRDRDWSDDEGSFEPEPALRAVLANAAVASYTRGPNVLADYSAISADAIDAFTNAGSGDADVLPSNPTSSDWSYHLHGPPSIGEQFETSVVFRTLVFDWEQVWGENRSWLGGGIEIAAALPIGKAGKLAKAGRALDRADDALDLRVPGGGLVAHETAGGHVIEKHIGRTIDELQARIDFEGIGAASSFIDVDRAEAAVAGALVSEHGRVADWLSTSEWKLVLDSTVDPNAGVVLRAGSSIAETPSTVRVVLIRDDVMSTGYQIRTSFLH